MKDKIKQAGFPTQKELASHLDITTVSISNWSSKLEKAPKWFSEYLDLRIENIALREALKTLKQYCNQGKVVDYLKAGKQEAFK